MKDNQNLMMISIVAIVAIVAIIIMPSQQQNQVSKNQLSELSTAGGAYYRADVTPLSCRDVYILGNWKCGDEETACQESMDELGDPECEDENNNNYCSSGTCQRSPEDDGIGCLESEIDGDSCWRAHKLCNWECSPDPER